MKNLLAKLKSMWAINITFITEKATTSAKLENAVDENTQAAFELQMEASKPTQVLNDMVRGMRKRRG